MSAFGPTVEPSRIAGDLRHLADSIGPPERLIEDILPTVAFRLREIRFLSSNLAHLVTQACRQYEDRGLNEPVWWSEEYPEWVEDHLNIREPAY